jgi:hypothetical protein
MELMNWLVKNGPGSPGSTAKTYIKVYNEITRTTSVNYDKDWEGILSALFLHRLAVNQRTGFQGGSLLGTLPNPSEFIKMSNGDMAFFIFSMMVFESSQFRYSIMDGNLPAFDAATSAIYEVVKSKAPVTLKYDLQNFQQQAVCWTVASMEHLFKADLLL